MQVQISAQHFDVTEAIERHVHDKLARLKKHFDHVVNAHVVLKVQKGEHVAEATIHVRRHDFFADARAADLYAAIDTLAHRLDRQILRHKEKVRDHHSQESQHHLPPR